jgi:hypothetical protein
MDRDRVEQEFRALEESLDDPPPLLAIVVLANGRGLAYPYPLFDEAGAGPIEARTAALTMTRAFLWGFIERLDTQLLAIARAQAILRDEEGEPLPQEMDDE